MKYKVVITDDHTLVASAIRSMIERFTNFEVLFEARNGRQLLTQLKECAIFPDIILLDIDMPIMNGFEAMKELPAVLLLRPFNFETLATQVYQFASDELIEKSALSALIIVLVGIIPIILLDKSINHKTNSSQRK